MSLMVARKKRAALYLSICGLLAMVAAVTAVSARDPSGASLRIGMVMVTLGAAMWLNWRFAVPAAIAVWLGTNGIRNLADDTALFGTDMLLELPGLIGVAAFAAVARHSLKTLEDENILLGATSDEHSGVDPETGVYEERLLRPAIETEVARARRFRREFALVLIGIDAMRQRFDYRDEEAWESSFVATARLLRGTRNNIDRAYRYGATNFALVLPESSQRDVTGLVRRLRRIARHTQPVEGEPGGPLPTHFGATFYPQCATSTDDLLRRAEIALRIAEKNSSRMQLDSAEAPEMASPATMRRADEEAASATARQPGTEVAVLLAGDTTSLTEAVQAFNPTRPDAVVPIPLHGSPGSVLDDPHFEDEDDLDTDYEDLEDIDFEDDELDDLDDQDVEEVAPVYALAPTAGEDSVWQAPPSEPGLVAAFAETEPTSIAEPAAGFDEVAIETQSEVPVYAYETDEAPQALWDALSPEERAVFEASASIAPEPLYIEPAIEEIAPVEAEAFAAVIDEDTVPVEAEADAAVAEWEQFVASAAAEPSAFEPAAIAEEVPVLDLEPAAEAVEPQAEPGPAWEPEPIAWPRTVVASEAPDEQPEAAAELPEPIAWPFRVDEPSAQPEPVLAYQPPANGAEPEPEAPRSVPYLRAISADERPTDWEPDDAPQQEETLDELLRRMDQTLDLLKTLKSGTGP